MKKWLLALVPGLVLAQPIPDIMGYIKNRDNGRIVFTMVRGACPEGWSAVYSTADGGKVAVSGCYRLIGEDLMVRWGDGDTYSYPFVDLEFTQEFLRFVEAKQGKVPI